MVSSMLYICVQLLRCDSVTNAVVSIGCNSIDMRLVLDCCSEWTEPSGCTHVQHSKKLPVCRTRLQLTSDHLDALIQRQSLYKTRLLLAA